MDRRDFVMSGAAFLAGGAFSGSDGWGKTERYALLQREIDAVRASDYREYLRSFRPALLKAFPALDRLESAIDSLAQEVKDTRASDTPAVWILYNMGIVVKTRQACFSIDLMHRRGHELSKLLDFALITHNHDDHYTMAFYEAMNGAGKTVISNFLDNYGVADRHTDGGFTRKEKTFRIRDVEITAGLTDHNDYLIDFTSVFEIRYGDFTLYHSGDCCNVSKLNPTRRPDLWFVHPRCGLDVGACVRKFSPRRTIIAHLNELGHDVGKWRWTWEDGVSAKEAVEREGGAACVPVWGERII